MKKTLLATTTALAAGLIAAPLFASEAPKASVRGYATAGFGYNDSNPADDFGIEQDGEVHFRWSGSSDNGLTFKGEVELEAFSSADQIDEYWVSVSGSFGDLRFAGDDTAAEYMELGIIYSPYAKYGYYDAFGYSGSTGTSSNGDDMGVYYITPAISGFTAAISWQPDGQDDGFGQNHSYPIYATPVNGATGDNVVSVGAQYMGEFDAFSFGISGGYETSDKGPQPLDTDTWNAGAYVGFSGFTVAAFYEDNPEIAGDGYDLALGVSYATGPWTFAGGWAMRDDTTGGVLDLDTFSGWVTYAIAPGVTGTVAVEYTDNHSGGFPGIPDDTLAAGAYLGISF